MEKKRIINKEETISIYDFYCDDCGKLIMSSEEFDDGYVPTPNGPHYKLFLNNTWFKNSDYLCEECWKKKINKIIEFLKENGFQENQM